MNGQPTDSPVGQEPLLGSGGRCLVKDASAVVAKYAPKLAAEKGFIIRVMHACNADLEKKCGRTYDCIFSDGLDELATRDVLAASASGIYAVLNDGSNTVHRRWQVTTMASTEPGHSDDAEDRAADGCRCRWKGLL